MRLSRTFWIILGVAVFAVAFGLLYMYYSRQLSEQEQLRSTLAVKQAALAKLVTDRENWQSQVVKLQEEIAQHQSALADARLALTTAQSGWPKTAESIEYDEKLFDMADSWNLDISVVTAAEPADTKVADTTFTTASFTVTVTGKPIESRFTEPDEYRDYIYDTVNDILSFLHTIVNDEGFATASIELVTLGVPTPLTEEELDQKDLKAQQAELGKLTASITLTVYTYK